MYVVLVLVLRPRTGSEDDDVRRTDGTWCAESRVASQSRASWDSRAVEGLVIRRDSFSSSRGIETDERTRGRRTFVD